MVGVWSVGLLRGLTSSATLSAGATVWPEVKALLERLMVAEQLGSQVNQDLSNLLTQLKDLTAAVKDTSPTTGCSSSAPAGRLLVSVGQASTRACVTLHSCCQLPVSKVSPEERLQIAPSITLNAFGVAFIRINE